MSTDSSKPTEAHTPIDVAIEGLVLRPEIFNTPGPHAHDDGKPNLWPPHAAAAAREKADLSLAASNVFPLWALIPIIGVVLAAGSFLGANMALGPNVKGYSYELTPPDGEAASAIELDEYDLSVWKAKGKAEYATVCASCHQASGEGVPGLYPPLKDSEYVIHGEQRVIALLLHGIVGPLQVNGKSYNGAMPAQGAVKNNKAVAQIASYIRNDWGNQASIIYDDQVAFLRKELAARTVSYVEADLKAIPQDANLPPSKHGGAPPAADAAAAIPVAAVAPAAASPPAAAPAAAATPAPAAALPGAPAAPAKN